ncbi:MAG: hypothetical protein JWR83_2189, partial [Aeromicrobium sp.]|nr:hypothetical protein [Aeromicrobium sp.]
LQKISSGQGLQASDLDLATLDAREDHLTEIDD